MKALSIRQPWAFAILHGRKDIENRRWATRFRGEVAIHASGGMTRDEVEDFRAFIDMAELGGEWLDGRTVGSLPRGGVVGIATVVDCVTESRSPWFFGPHGFVLERARPVPFIPCKGALGFFDLPPEVAAAVRAA